MYFSWYYCIHVASSVLLRYCALVLRTNRLTSSRQLDSPVVQAALFSLVLVDVIVGACVSVCSRGWCSYWCGHYLLTRKSCVNVHFHTINMAQCSESWFCRTQCASVAHGTYTIITTKNHAWIFTKKSSTQSIVPTPTKRRTCDML